jgi:hypothetical protein
MLLFSKTCPAQTLSGCAVSRRQVTTTQCTAEPRVRTTTRQNADSCCRTYMEFLRQIALSSLDACGHSPCHCDLMGVGYCRRGPTAPALSVGKAKDT